MRLSKPSVLLATLVPVLALLAAACGGDPTPTPTAPATETPTPPPSDNGTATPDATPTATATRAPTATPEPGLEERLEEHFTGKTIDLIAAYSPGGGNDTMMRLIQVHIRNHIPGNPNTVVQNLSGGEGIRAAQHTISQPADGTTIGSANRIVLQQGALGAEFQGVNVEELTMLGSPHHSPGTNLICVDSERVGRSWEEAIEWGESSGPITLPEDGLNGWPAFLQQVLGLPFRVIPAYSGSTPLMAAFAQGETNGLSFCSTARIPSEFPELMDPDRMTPILNPECVPNEDIQEFLDEGGWDAPPCIPDVVDLDADQEQIMNAWLRSTSSRVHFLYAHPDTPDWIAQGLHNAIEDMSNDPAFQADYTDRGYLARHLPGQAYIELYESVRDLPEHLVDEYRLMAGLSE